MISVLIPVRNGGLELARCLDRIRDQQIGEDYEVLVVDSASTDGTPEIARERGAGVHTIAAEEFHHGATRNLCGRMAAGDVLVFTTHDAYPEDEHWLELLVRPLREDPGVAGVYGRQLAHLDASPPEVYFMDFLYGERARTQRAASVAELTMETTLFSNANSAIRRSVWEEFPFAEDVLIAEDQDWSRRVLLAGHAIAYEPRAGVRHSHAYTLFTAFRRFFESGVAAERNFLAGGDQARGVLRRRAVDYASGELRWLWSTGRRRWIPYAALYEAGKFLGLQLGARHRRLPLWLKRRWTRYPGWFTGEGGPGAPRG